MPLFQKSVLNKHLNELNAENVQSAYEKYRVYFHDLRIQKNILSSKEEQFQEGFLRELFVAVFGYVLNPQPDFNLTTEFKNEKGAKKADGAILKDGKAVAVIELKSTKTKDLESIRQQAFDYKANQSGCVYVITSNFQKLRFYINNAVEFEEFDLFSLTIERFKLLFMCLNGENLLADLPLKVKNASLLEEEQITKKFYDDYSQFKRELFENIGKRNEDLENVTKLQLYKKTQKLLDRFLFIFFAEDRNLLPPNSISRMIKRWNTLNDEDAYKPLYDIYKQYFGYINTGRAGKVPADDIHEYNGGLFLPDELLDTIEIDDDVLLKHTTILTNYDFESQVDVNILGHIFEHSLNEIESTTAQLEGVDFDKQKSKRKKDGVFYTPKYITKYIVDNTVGKLCEEKKAELAIVEEEFTPIRKKDTKRKLLVSLESYRSWLLQLTICDPACGSGAFLNQALEFLINEHHYIDQLNAQLFGSNMVFQDVENQILENNIFGVDINEESVDIARLSLWLRTAERGRKLTTLNKNIKCGNSLIDDPEVAGDKAFHWEEEFPQVFAKGGFDVVIGNPPYGAKLSHNETEYCNKHFRHQSYQLDSYLLFTEKIENWLKNGGYGGYIMPNTWLSSLYGKQIRKFVLTNFELLNLVHYAFFVFEDATVETDTYIFRKSKPNDSSYINLLISDGKGLESKQQLPQSTWNSLDGEPINIYQSSEATEIKTRLSHLKKIGDVTQIVQGTKPFQKGKGLPKQTEETMKMKPFVSCLKKDDSFIPLLRGSLMNKYIIHWLNDYWISYGDWLAEPRYSAKFNSDEKLIIRQTGDSLIATYDNRRFVVRDNLYVIRDDNNMFNMKGLLAVINSKFYNWYFQNIINPERGKAMAQVKRGHLKQLPILNSRFDSLEPLADKMLRKNQILQKSTGSFKNYLRSNFTNLEVTSKLTNWHELDFTDFIKELNKAIKKAGGDKLSKMDEMEWMEVFETKKAEALTVKAEIDRTDREIDKMVYELYGLTEEEIRIVEES